MTVGNTDNVRAAVQHGLQPTTLPAIVRRRGSSRTLDACGARRAFFPEGFVVATSGDIGRVQTSQLESLGGRCGKCEMNAHCGGCRARAYGMTGDLMAEDPLCTHTPGKFVGSPLLILQGPAAVAGSPALSERSRCLHPRYSARTASGTRGAKGPREWSEPRGSGGSAESSRRYSPGQGRGVLPPERPRPRDRRRARPDSLADADAEAFRVGAAAMTTTPCDDEPYARAPSGCMKVPPHALICFSSTQSNSLAANSSDLGV